MKHLSNVLFAIILGFIMSGCASTSMTSFTDPSYRASSFYRVLVIANVSDLAWRKTIESRMVKEFKSYHVFAVEGMELFPPTRTFSDDQKVEILNTQNIDSYVLIDVGETGTQSVYIPPTGTTTTTNGRVNVYGNTTTYQQQSTTTTDGGYTVNKPWAKFQAKFVDVSTGRTAWIATAVTGGNAFASFNTVVNSFCGKTVDQLVDDGLAKGAPPREEKEKAKEKSFREY